MTLAPRFLIRLWVRLLASDLKRRLRAPGGAVRAQQATFAALVARLAGTEYGRAAGLTAGLSYEQFRTRVPLRPRGFFQPYVDRMGGGETDVLWPGRCRFFIETAGATGEPRQYPVTAEMLGHFRAALRDALVLHAIRTGRQTVFLGRHVHAGGSTALTGNNDLHVGSLDSILALCLTPWARANLYALPDEVAHLPEGPERAAATARALDGEKVTLIGGGPAAVLATVDAVRQAARRSAPVAPPLREVWPACECHLHTGAPLGLFATELKSALDREIVRHELYAAAEGIIAAQDAEPTAGLRLLADTGLFFEFLPAADFHEARLPELGPRCRPLAEVEPDCDYHLVLTNPSGLCRGLIGDVVRFASVDPPRLRFVARAALVLDSFGERTGERELTESLLAVCAANDWTAVDFHVAPYFSRTSAGIARGCHEWWVELQPGTMKTPTGPILAPQLDAALKERSASYAARRGDRSLEAPVVRLVMPGVFMQWAQLAPAFGGVSKMPRCRPDRLIADQLAGLTQFSTTEAPFGAGPALAKSLVIRPDEVPANPVAGSSKNPLQGSRDPFH